MLSQPVTSKSQSAVSRWDSSERRAPIEAQAGGAGAGWGGVHHSDGSLAHIPDIGWESDELPHGMGFWEVQCCGWVVWWVVVVWWLVVGLSMEV